MKSKIFVFVLVLIMVLLLINSCHHSISTHLDLPEVTGELSICMYDSPGPYNDAINNFIMQHPDINITVEKIVNSIWALSEDADSLLAERAAQIQRIETEAMSGLGADIFLLDTSHSASYTLFPDLIKVSMAGVFLDFSPYIQDSSFIDLKDYYKGVITATTYKDKQYILPLSFSVPLVVSTKANLDSIGLNTRQAKKSIYSFDNELFGKLPEDQSWTLVRDSSFIAVIEEKLIDYNTKTVNFDNEAIRYTFAQMKETWQRTQDKGMKDKLLNFISLSNYERAKRLIAGDPLLFMLGTATTATSLAQAIKYNGIEPELFPIPNENGGLSADMLDCATIRSNSKNVGTALLLLQYLLSKEVQTTHSYSNIESLPVRRDALDDALEYERTFNGGANGYGTESLSDKCISDLQKLLDGVTTVYVQNILSPSVKIEGADIQQELYNYLSGQITYNEMADLIEPKLILYLNE